MSRSSRMRDMDYGRDESRRSRMSSEINSVSSRVFIGNTNIKNFTHRDVYEWMNKYGKVLDVALFDRHILIQFDRESDARRAIDREKGQSYRGSRFDIRFASSSDGPMDSRSEAPRARSPVTARQLPYERDSRDMSPYRESMRDRSPIDRDRYYKDRHNSPEYRKYERSRNSADDNRSRPDYPNIPKDVQEPKWNSPPFTDKIASDRPGFDAAIIVMSSELLNYAETIESRLQRQIALTTHIIVLKEESHANACVEDLNNKGVLYAFLVNGLNEKHFSCTLRILYGTPQEHRNMPLNNALSFVARNFESYQKRVRDLKSIAPKPTFDPSRMPPGFIAPDDKIIYYLHLLADSRMLTNEELNELIEFVQKRIQALANAEETMEKISIPGIPVESISNNVSSKMSMPPGSQPVRDEKVIQHQTQLHSKILNILKPVSNQSASIIGDSGDLGNVEPYNAYNESNSSASKSNMGLNPKVQQALDTLMQSQFRPNVSEQAISLEENSRNFSSSNNQLPSNPYSMNPSSNMRPVNPHPGQSRPAMNSQGAAGQNFGNNFHGYYQQPPLGQPLYRGRPPFPPRPQYPGY